MYLNNGDVVLVVGCHYGLRPGDVHVVMPFSDSTMSMACRVAGSGLYRARSGLLDVVVKLI